MNKRVALCVFGVVAIGIIAFLWFDRRQPAVSAPTTQTPFAVAAESAPAITTGIGSSPAGPASRSLATSGRASQSDAASTNDQVAALKRMDEKAVRIRPGEVLVTINGVSLTLSDLMATDPSDTNTVHSMSEGEYKYLLDRAINRELTFQEARRQGVQLTVEQQARLDQIARTMRGRDGSNPQNVLAHLNSTAPLNAEIQFEQRDAAGLLLQESLMQRSGGPPPYVTENQVQQYYQQNIQRYGDLPAQADQREASWRLIDAQIRADLSLSTMQAHQATMEAYLTRLKGGADIQYGNVLHKQP